MNILWGEVPVSDAHIHFFSHKLFEALARQKGLKSGAEAVRLLEWEAPPEDPATLARNWLVELDRYGLERAAIIASIPGDQDSVAAALARYPDRFYGFFMCDPTAEGAIEGVEKALAQGLQGVCMFPAMHRYSVHDDRVKTVFDLLSKRRGVLAFVHCGVLSVGVREKLGLPSPFDMRYSNPLDLHAIALRYPDLPFVVPHFGAGFFREALMLADLCPNVHLDTSSTNSWLKFQPSVMDLSMVFKRCLDVLGSRRLLFGTDSSYFPRGWQKTIFHDQVKALNDVGASAEDARLILGGNLERLLKKS